MRKIYSSVIIFASLLLISFSGFSQINDTLRVSPPFIIKVGAGFYVDVINDGFEFAQVDLDLEVPIGKKFSIGGNLTPTVSDQRMESEVARSVNVRYFINKDHFPNRKIGQRSEWTLSGVYLAAVYSKQTDKRKGESSLFDPERAYSKQFTFTSYNRYGVEFGRQIISQASVDFAVFAGFEDALERVGYENKGFQARNTRYFTVHSRFTPYLAISDLWRATVKRSTSKSLQIDGNGTVFKTGLQDVFSFSKAGIYFFPKLAFELPLRKAPMTFGVKTETYFSRNHLFDYNYSNETYTSYRSPKPYLNQRILFSISPQLKYFLFKKDPESTNLTKIEGVYFVADATARFGSTEIKREVWDFNRFHGHSVGLGGGIQKIIAGKVLLDSYLIIDKPLSTTDYKQPVSVRAGIQYSWLRNL